MISIATAPGGGKPNEDWVGATSQLVVVLDGLSTPEGVGGCSHGTPWYVARLGARLIAHADSNQESLQEALSAAIRDVADLHRDTCDLTDLGTPSTTAAIFRRRAETAEALVLSDSTVLVEDSDGRIETLTDSRVDDSLPAEQEAALASLAAPDHMERVAELVRAQRRVRNTPTGYWVAQADPRVAEHAFTRTWPAASVRRAALMSDGAARLVDLFHVSTWRRFLDTLVAEGPDHLIAMTRDLERQDPDGTRWPRLKQSDDATLALWQL